MKCLRLTLSMKHFQFISRTWTVVNNNVVKASGDMMSTLKSDRILEKISLNARFEKPYQKRNKICYGKCRNLYNEDMKRKIDFVMRKNRKDPFPR
ncbi:hypothetical protein KUTeg_022727 [Tegillarca granosa]|uniref:Uncharacterized protein n=1 Tax=Tegillarca granosa TaxID=220873 RepID=A0ABQ9E455_TEGGR|nr:hypothetical protein KUTeg_022727 [Tegillarca granosa]